MSPPQSPSLSTGGLPIILNRMNQAPQRAPEDAQRSTRFTRSDWRIAHESMVGQAAHRLTGPPGHRNPPPSHSSGRYLPANCRHPAFWRPWRPWRPKPLGIVDNAALVRAFPMSRIALSANDLRCAGDKRLDDWLPVRKQPAPVQARCGRVLGVLASLERCRMFHVEKEKTVKSITVSPPAHTFIVGGLFWNQDGRFANDTVTKRVHDAPAPEPCALAAANVVTTEL